MLCHFCPVFLVIRTKQCNGGHYDEWRLAQEKFPAMSEQVNSSNIRLHKAVITDPETKFSGATWRRRTKITTWQLCPTHVTALVSWIMFGISGILFNFNFKSGVNHPEHWTDLVALQEAHTPLPHYEKKDEMWLLRTINNKKSSRSLTLESLKLPEPVGSDELFVLAGQVELCFQLVWKEEGKVEKSGLGKPVANRTGRYFCIRHPVFRSGGILWEDVNVSWLEQSWQKKTIAHLEDTDGKLKGGGKAGNCSINSLANFSDLLRQNHWLSVAGKSIILTNLDFLCFASALSTSFSLK